MPHVEGLTESLDVRSWNPPFPVDQRRIEDRDEAYWDAHGAAPRMLVSPATARDIWSQALSPTSGGGGERYITGLLMKTSSEESVQTLATRLAADLQPEVMGVAVRNVRDEALAAARGSSDYTGLFVGLGAFLVVASALLVALLGRLNVERRAGQTGLLLAVGFTRRQCARLLAGEALVLTVLAALLAVPLGVAYGAGLMAGLNVLWPEALAGLRIALHVSWLSVLTGVVFGGLAAAVALGWGLAGLRGRSVLELLAGWRSYSAATAMDGRADRVQRRLRIGSVVGALLVAMGVGAVAAGYLQLWSTVAAFFAGGVMLLSGGLMLMWSRMGALAPAAIGGGWGLNRLAWQWLGRNRMRSLLTMSLIATAAFALAAVAANRREAEVLGNAGAVSRSGGAGGYQLKIETQLPLPVPLNAYLSRQMAESPARGDEALVRAMHVDSLRVQQGDDISCLNIAQPLSPRVVGVGAAMVERGGFRLAGHEPSAGVSADELAERPLRLLEVRGDENDRAIPVMGDEASLRWILGRRLGELFEIDSPRGPLKVRLVGMLKGSIWQSELLMSEENFVHAFGAEGGYGLFLAEVADDGVDRAAASLADRLSAVGVRVTPTAGMLAEFASVQNAYLATFQTLGGLGLGLGMLGLVTVMFRAAEERRRELALLRAIGFSRRSLLRLLVTEAGMLLTIGLAIGALAALVAVLPQVMASAGAVPWSALGLTLAGVWVFGLACCAAAAWRISRSDLLSSLRRE